MSRFIKSLVIGASATVLASCASDLTPTSGNLSKQLDIVPGGQEPGEHDPVARAAFWGTRYDRNPNNPDAAVTFSEALRTMGSNEESLKVMTRVHRQFTDNADVNLEYGKSLIANDRAFEAVRPLENAIENGKGRDWKAYSAYGIALDKIGEHRSARAQYDIALKLSPNSHVILNNKGLSYALSGQLRKAEATLRYAAATSTGTATVRQNLALVLSFKGDVSEAERLARSDLPPRIANNNVAYFKSLVSQPAYWQEFAGDNIEMPTFESPAPTTPVEEVPVPRIPATKMPKELAPEQETPTPDKPEADVLSSVEGVAPLAASNGSIQAPKVTGTPVQLEQTSTKEKPAEDDAGA